MNKVKRWLWGLVLIALGVILGINALGIAQIDIFFPGWWTLFIIVPCTISLFTDDDKVGDLIGIGLGVALMLASLDVIDFSMVWKLVLPAALVLIGLSIIFKDVVKKKVIDGLERVEGSYKGKQYVSTFAGQNLNFAGEKFEGCKLEAIFGGIKCDLRETKITDDVMIKANAIFGGVTILAPEDVNVEVISNSIFGGTSNKHEVKAKEGQKTIYVDANSVFGGVDIK